MSQLIQLPFKAGIDEGTDPKQLPPGTLKIGENVRQDKAGRVRKRFGATGIDTRDLDGGAVEGERILRIGKALVLSDGVDVIPSLGASGSKWSRVDRVPSLVSTAHPLIDMTTTTSQATVAISGSFRITVYSTALAGFAVAPAGAIYVQIDDHETGAVVMPPTLVNASASQPRIFETGTSVVYIAYVTAAGDLKITALNPSFQTFSFAPTTLKAGVGVWDGVFAGGLLYFACSTAAGLVAERWNPNPVWTQTHTIALAGAATYKAIAVDVTGGVNMRVVYSTTAPTTRVFTLLASNLAIVAGPTIVFGTEAVALAVIGTITGQMIVASTSVDSVLFHLLTRSAVVDDTTHAIVTTAGYERTYHVAIASRLFEVNFRYYFAATVAVIPPTIATSNDTEVSPHSTVVIECNPHVDSTAAPVPHRRMGTLESRTSEIQLYAVTQPSTDSDGRVHIMTARKQREPVGTEAVPLGVVCHVLEERGADWCATLDVSESALAVAASPFFLDGGSAHPYGFIHEPDILTANKGIAGTGSMLAGDYIYCCVYEWRDSRGVLHRSAPSAVVRVTGVVATGSVVLRIAQTSIDCKQSATSGFGSAAVSPVRIVIYRGTAGGNALFRLTHEPTFNFQYNDPASASVTFTDQKSDLSIASAGPVIRLDSRPQLYTGSELAEVNPGAATTGTVHRNRAWLVSADRRTVQFSKKIDEDVSVAPGFNEELVLLFTSDKYFLASLDDKLVAGGDCIDIVYGDGPASDGSGIDWQIQRLHSDIGCTNPKSVAVIPPGLVFRSSRGFELLDRGLNVTYIGTPVEDTLAAYPVVTSAVLVPNEQEVRFTCTSEDGATGVVIVLNYAFRAWYVRKFWNDATALFDAPFVDAALVDGVYTMLSGDGSLWQESASVFYDDPLSGGDHYVSMKVAVPVYPTGAGGWHRLRSVQIVGESKTHHKLVIEASRDFVEAYEQQKVFADGTPPTSPGPIEQARMTLRHQKRQAAVITIYDLAPDTEALTTGEGPILSALDVYFEPKEGPAKLAAGKKG